MTRPDSSIPMLRSKASALAKARPKTDCVVPLGKWESALISPAEGKAIPDMGCVCKTFVPFLGKLTCFGFISVHIVLPVFPGRLYIEYSQPFLSDLSYNFTSTLSLVIFEVTLLCLVSIYLFPSTLYLNL